MKTNKWATTGTELSFISFPWYQPCVWLSSQNALCPWQYQHALSTHQSVRHTHTRTYSLHLMGFMQHLVCIIETIPLHSCAGLFCVADFGWGLRKKKNKPIPESSKWYHMPKNTLCDINYVIESRMCPAGSLLEPVGGGVMLPEGRGHVGVGVEQPPSGSHLV